MNINNLTHSIKYKLNIKNNKKTNFKPNMNNYIKKNLQLK